MVQNFSVTISLVLQLLFSCLIFSVPLNLFLKLNESSSYVDGLRIDYLINKIYLADIFIGLIFLVWFWQTFKKKQVLKLKLFSKNWPKLIFGMIFIAVQFLSLQPMTAFWFLSKIIQLGLFLAFIKQHRQLLTTTTTLYTVLITLIFQTSLAIYQFLTQQPLLPYHFLGEPNFTPYYRLSRHLFWGGERIIPYGTTAHPNVLAGLGVIFFLILWRASVQFKPQSQKVIKAISLICVLTLILLTQSWSALLVLVAVNLAWAIEKAKIKLNLNIKLAILMFIFVVSPFILSWFNQAFDHQPSLERRTLLNQAGWFLLAQHPLIGVGLNNFTVNLNQTPVVRQLNNFIQPAHHVPLLFLAETGLLGVLTISWWYRRLGERQQQQLITALLIISPILVLDHYFYTLQTGRLLMLFYLSYQLFTQSQSKV